MKTKTAANFINVILLSIIIMTTSCSNPSKETESTEETAATDTVGITKEDFGTTADGEKVEEYTLTNSNGVEMKVITLGGIITSFKAPDNKGNMGDVVLGFREVKPYETESPYIGAIIGRYGNRIAKGKFSLDGQEYDLVTNNGANHLHGGTKGFDKVVWKAQEIKNPEAIGLKLTYLSKDMEEGYPGNLNVTVTYLLTNEDALEIDYTATTDKKTVVNLTQHTYFNLSADPNQSILDHELVVNASRFLPIDSSLIPTGELRDVEGTPFDFTSAKEVGTDIEKDDEQLKFGLGYDHCWVLDGEGMRKAATLYHKESGRFMEVWTTEPAIQVYSGNFLDGTLAGKDGIEYQKRSAICLETEHYPDSPNQEAFPSVILEPGQTYNTKTTYKFAVE
ncbi:aldose epimerase family protein [Fulvivirga ligni]|uniref:aldose epimerase family protein n=1 Tax=Fulvivirga ligni TaxID=2904246 RepID=UPI001F25B826|nr:aldose epimerase family protein [Fulvivirga ligni]UII23448.1 galactose mutarotase [Fulvivirga ligni]